MNLDGLSGRARLQRRCQSHSTALQRCRATAKTGLKSSVTQGCCLSAVVKPSLESSVARDKRARDHWRTQPSSRDLSPRESRLRRREIALRSEDPSRYAWEK